MLIPWVSLLSITKETNTKPICPWESGGKKICDHSGLNFHLKWENLSNLSG